MRMMGEGKNKNTIVKILVGVIIVLILFIAYFFVVGPQINKVIYQKQVEAANIVTNNIYADMINQLQTNGAYQVKVGNQTLVLVPYIPSQTNGAS